MSTESFEGWWNHAKTLPAQSCWTLAARYLSHWNSYLAQYWVNNRSFPNTKMKFPPHGSRRRQLILSINVFYANNLVAINGWRNIAERSWVKCDFLVSNIIKKTLLHCLWQAFFLSRTACNLFINFLFHRLYCDLFLASTWTYRKQSILFLDQRKVIFVIARLSDCLKFKLVQIMLTPNGAFIKLLLRLPLLLDSYLQRQFLLGWLWTHINRFIMKGSDLNIPLCLVQDALQIQ